MYPHPAIASPARRTKPAILLMRRMLVAGWCVTSSVGCSLSLGPVLAEAIGDNHGTQVGGHVRGLVELPRDFRTVVGTDVTVDRQISRDAEGVRERVAILGGLTGIPDRTGKRVGWELLGRLGYLWARLDHPMQDSAFFYGGEFGLPIRLGRTLTPWNADGVTTYDFMLVPSAGIDHMVGLSARSHHLETSVGLALRLHVDSALLP